MLSRVLVGRDVDVVSQGDQDVELVGKVRLRPGFVIEIVPGRPGSAVKGGPALVLSWRIRVLGRFGPIYRGMCRWFPSNVGHRAGDRPSEAEYPHKPIEHASGTGLDALRAGRGARR